jgi:hypothetical protein
MKKVPFSGKLQEYFGLNSMLMFIEDNVLICKEYISTEGLKAFNKIRNGDIVSLIQKNDISFLGVVDRTFLYNNNTMFEIRIIVNPEYNQLSKI